MDPICRACGHDDVSAPSPAADLLRRLAGLGPAWPRCGARDEATGDVAGEGPCPCPDGHHRALPAPQGSAVPGRRATFSSRAPAPAP